MLALGVEILIYIRLNILILIYTRLYYHDLYCSIDQDQQNLYSSTDQNLYYSIDLDLSLYSSINPDLLFSIDKDLFSNVRKNCRCIKMKHRTGPKNIGFGYV